MTVDDRLVGADGKPLEDVPHMGISATKIGEAVGQAIVDEIKKRGWNMSECRRDPRLLRPASDGRRSCRRRHFGAEGKRFQGRQHFDAPQAKTDTEAALNAATVVLNKPMPTSRSGLPSASTTKPCSAPCVLPKASAFRPTA
jgi:L-arabinose transport system substrate-binding protein